MQASIVEAIGAAPTATRRRGAWAAAAQRPGLRPREAPACSRRNAPPRGCSPPAAPSRWHKPAGRPARSMPRSAPAGAAAGAASAADVAGPAQQLDVRVAADHAGGRTGRIEQDAIEGPRHPTSAGRPQVGDHAAGAAAEPLQVLGHALRAAAHRRPPPSARMPGASSSSVAALAAGRGAGIQHALAGAGRPAARAAQLRAGVLHRHQAFAEAAAAPSHSTGLLEHDAACQPGPACAASPAAPAAQQVPSRVRAQRVHAQRQRRIRCWPPAAASPAVGPGCRAARRPATADARAAWPVRASTPRTSASRSRRNRRSTALTKPPAAGRARPRARHPPRCSPPTRGAAREYSQLVHAPRTSSARSSGAICSASASAAARPAAHSAGTSAACRHGSRARRRARSRQASAAATAARPRRCSPRSTTRSTRARGHGQRAPRPGRPRRPASLPWRRSCERTARRPARCPFMNSRAPSPAAPPARCSCSDAASTPAPQATSQRIVVQPQHGAGPGCRACRRRSSRARDCISSFTGSPVQPRLGHRPGIEGAHLPVDRARALDSSPRAPRPC